MDGGEGEGSEGCKEDIDRWGRSFGYSSVHPFITGAKLISEFATDLKEIYPEKEVTLLHSRPQLMPIYPIEVHVAGALRVFDLGAQANSQQ